MTEESNVQNKSLSVQDIENRICDKYPNLIIKESDICSMQDIENTAKRIVKLQRIGQLVPVICEDMYEYEDQAGNRQSLHSYMVEKIIKDNNNIRLTRQELTDVITESYYGNQVIEEKMGKKIWNKLYDTVFDFDDNIKDGICLKKEVEDFLRAGNFPLIITTSCFPILESRLKDFQYTSVWYKLFDRATGSLPENCIYHFFGQANAGNPNWGYNDNMLLQFLCSAYSKDTAPLNLTSYIANTNSRRTLFFIGNDAPDWLFRFMLTPMFGGDVYAEGKNREENGFYMNEKHCKDAESLDHFLKDTNFVKESRVTNILNRVTEIFNKTNSRPQSKEPHGKRYDFFISHASEDTDLALKLKEVLNSHGIKAWVDESNKLKMDGPYWQRIIDAMNASAYFMPVISRKFMYKTKDEKDRSEAFKKLHIKEMAIDAELAKKLSDEMKAGVPVELLLAEKIQKNNPQYVYSVPVIQKGCKVMGSIIDTSFVEERAKDSNLLPSNLFYGQQIFELELDAEGNIASFELDWNRYKFKSGKE